MFALHTIAKVQRDVATVAEDDEAAAAAAAAAEEEEEDDVDEDEEAAEADGAKRAAFATDSFSAGTALVRLRERGSRLRLIAMDCLDESFQIAYFSVIRFGD